LTRLARGQAQAAVAIAARKTGQRQPLAWRAHAAWQAGAPHEAPGGLELLPRALLAQVTIVLLVAAVELDELPVGLAQAAGGRIGQALDQRAAQQAAGALDALDRGLAAHVNRHPAGSGHRPPAQ